MNTSLHTVRALLVSSSEAQTQRISALLTRARIVPFDHTDSARQALEQFDAGGIDGVLIAEPVAGSSGQENIGFAREGKECLYNILIMEEMQSIAALGAGASTKCYDRQRHIVSRVENVKSVTDYISRIDEMLQRKQEHGMGD